jgi:hypothetical protein
MSAMPTMFAEVLTLDEAWAQWGKMTDGMRQTLILLGALGAVAIGVWIVVWVFFFRTPRRHHHRHRHGHHHGGHHERESSPGPAGEAAATDGEDEPSHGRRKRRHRRREHRPLNPTLAETGGLPPVRTGDPPEIKP